MNFHGVHCSESLLLSCKRRFVLAAWKFSEAAITRNCCHEDSQYTKYSTIRTVDRRAKAIFTWKFAFFSLLEMQEGKLLRLNSWLRLLSFPRDIFMSFAAHNVDGIYATNKHDLSETANSEDIWMKCDFKTFFSAARLTLKFLILLVLFFSQSHLDGHIEISTLVKNW